MGLEHKHGRQAQCIKANIRMIKSMGKAYIDGLMVNNILDNGLMGKFKEEAA